MKTLGQLGRVASELLYIRTFVRVIGDLERKYGKGIDRPRIKEWMDDLKDAFGSLKAVKGKRILDLGCGSTIPPETIPSIKALREKQLQGQSIEGDADLARLRQLQENSNGRFSYDSLLSFVKSNGDATRARISEPWLPRLLLELGAQPVGIDIGNLEGESFEHYYVDLSQPRALDFLPNRSFDAVHSRGLYTSGQLEKTASSDERVALLTQQLPTEYARLLKDGGLILNRTYPIIMH